ncbi:MAG: hypothetical protein AAF663_00785 [Planctomycetota bacterium]
MGEPQTPEHLGWTIVEYDQIVGAGRDITWEYRAVGGEVVQHQWIGKPAEREGLGDNGRIALLIIGSADGIHARSVTCSIGVGVRTEADLLTVAGVIGAAGQALGKAAGHPEPDEVMRWAVRKFYADAEAAAEGLETLEVAALDAGGFRFSYTPLQQGFPLITLSVEPATQAAEERAAE